MKKIKFTFGTLLLAVLNISCMTVDRQGVLFYGSSKSVKEHKIIYDKILPYIAEALEYNNPAGTSDSNRAKGFRTIPTVNNMNYDKFVDCQDYALLFYALCKHYKIPCKLVGNNTLLHAYNRLNGKINIEPQSGENDVFIIGNINELTGKKGDFFRKIKTTHDGDILMEINEWNALAKQGGHVSAANMELFNYVVQNGELPGLKMKKQYPEKRDLFINNSETIIMPSVGFNRSGYSIVTIRDMFKGIKYNTNQVNMGVNVVLSAANQLCGVIHADIGFGGKINKTINGDTILNNAGTFSLATGIMGGYNFKPLRNLYIIGAGGVGFSTHIFNKTSFLSFTAPFDLELQYFFTRGFGVGVSAMYILGLGSFITNSEHGLQANNFGEWIHMSTAVKALSHDFIVKLGFTVRIPGQKGLRGL